MLLGPVLLIPRPVSVFGAVFQRSADWWDAGLAVGEAPFSVAFSDEW